MHGAPEPRSTRRRHPILWWTIACATAVCVLAAAALLVFVVLFGMRYGDRESAGQVIQNNTGDTVVVYIVDPDGTEYYAHGVAPGQAQELGGTCWSELVVRDSDGKFLARRGQFGDVLAEPFHEECDVPTWVIETPPS